MIEYYKNLSLESLFYINDEGLVCQEEWKDVIGWENWYQVSDLGRVKSLERQIKYKSGSIRNQKSSIIKGYPNKKFYLKLNFKMNTKRTMFSIHRLVAIAFLPNPLNLPEVNHIGKYPDGREGNKLDNRAISLEWCTRKQNVNHSWENGLSVSIVGETHYKSKLTNNNILDIRKIGKSKTLKEISDIYNITESNVSYILKSKTWKHI